jgi:hypothetical protein
MICAYLHDYSSFGFARSDVIEGESSVGAYAS